MSVCIGDYLKCTVARLQEVSREQFVARLPSEGEEEYHARLRAALLTHTR